MYNVYGSQNEFVEHVTRAFILRSLGQNGPLRWITVFAVARIEQNGRFLLGTTGYGLCHQIMIGYFAISFPIGILMIKLTC